MRSERRPLSYDDFWDFAIVGEAQLSPDGRRVAYVVARLERESDEPRSSVWVVDLESREASQFTSGQKSDSQPRWSPDGRWLAFVSTRHQDKPQIHVMSAQGGEAHRLTDREEGASNPAWSPDSATLAFTVPLKAQLQQLPSEVAWAAEKIERKDRPQIRRLAQMKHRSDGAGYADTRSHIFLVPREGGDARQLTDGDWDDLEPAWSPDGKVIAFMSNRTEDRDYNFADDVWLVEVGSGDVRVLTNGTLTAASPAWSPDGSTIAFYAEPEWIKNGTGNTHVWTVSRSGGDQRDLTPELDQTVGALLGDYGPVYSAPPAWSPDGQTMYFQASERGGEVLYSAPAGGGEARRLSDLDVHITMAQATPDGKDLLCVASTPMQPFEVCRISAGGGPLDRLTDSNKALLEAAHIAAPERFTFPSVDGWEIEGWLIRPPQTTGPCPLVMHVHGGPHGMYGSTFYYNMQVLAGAGIASVYFNPRGSAGYGKTFMRAADWGGNDFEDLMNGIDHVLSLGGIDADRLAVTGGSYGGFMTNWVVGHTDRFACAVAVNCLSNLVSFWGTSDIGALWFEQQMGGPFWEHWDRYREHSPLTYATEVTTPLLLIHAENDFRCPIEQSEQMYTALKWLRREVELARIPDASHGLANTPKPRHRIERWKLARAWFDRYLGTREVSHDGVGTAAM